MPKNIGQLQARTQGSWEHAGVGGTLEPPDIPPPPHRPPTHGKSLRCSFKKCGSGITRSRSKPGGIQREKGDLGGAVLPGTARAFRGEKGMLSHACRGWLGQKHGGFPDLGRKKKVFCVRRETRLFLSPATSHFPPLPPVMDGGVIKNKYRVGGISSGYFGGFA